MPVKQLLRAVSIVSGLAIALCGSVPAFGQAPKAQGSKDLTPELKRTRDALDKDKDPVMAIHDGYFSTLGCVTYPKPGAPGQVPYAAGGMGVHFLNVGLLGKPLDPLKPQILVYEPVGDKLQLVAAEWFVPLSPEVKERPRAFRQALRRPDGRASSAHAARPPPLRPARMVVEGQSCGAIRSDQSERQVSEGTLHAGRNVAADRSARAQVEGTPLHSRSAYTRAQRRL